MKDELPKRMIIPSFQRKGEIGTYVDHFIASVRFLLDLDLQIILKFFGLPLCQYTPGSHGSTIAFNSLLCLASISFSMDLFCYFFPLRIVRMDGLVSIRDY